MTTISDQDSLDGAMADDNMTKFGVDAGAFSYHMTMKNLRKAVDYPIVQPTGVEATDTQALINAYNALPASGGTIWIDDGELVLGNSGSGDNFYTFTKPVMLRGRRGQTAIIKSVDEYTLFWGSSLTGTFTSGGVAFSGIGAGESVFQSPNLTLSRGDWVVLWSEDSINGVDPHLTGGKQAPGEIRRVSRVDGSNIILSSPVVDEMTTTPKIAKLSMMPNCGLVDLQFYATGVTSDLYSQFVLYQTLNARVENLQATETGGGALYFGASAQAKISNFGGLYTARPQMTYALANVLCTDLLYQDSTWHECRHVVTTGTFNVGTTRYGNPVDCVVDNVTANCGGDSTETTFIVFDTHSEGYRTTFRNCRVYGGSEQIVTGYQSRARKTRFENCVFVGANRAANLGKGFVDAGSGMEIIGGRVENAWYGAEKDVAPKGSNLDDMLIDGTEFKNCETAAFYQSNTGDNITIKNITTSECGWRNNTSPAITKTLIHINGGTGHKIYNCQLNKQSKDGASNDYSIATYNGAPSGVWHEHVDFDFNFCRGYGANKLGVRGAIGDPNGVSVTEAESFNAEYISSDYSNRYDLT